MPKAAQAASCITNSVANSTFSSIWISDALLADTYRRFACQHRRHGSNVPGPLEARRRSAKRKNTSLAHIESSQPSIDPLWLSSNPQDGWWKGSSVATEKHIPTGLLPKWLFQTPDLSARSLHPTALVVEDAGIVDTHADELLARGEEDLVRTGLQKCEDVSDIHRLLQSQRVNLRASPNVADAVFTHVTNRSSNWRPAQLASYLTDPVFHPPGTQYHILFMQQFQESKYNAITWAAASQALCRATQLGLITPESLQSIVLLPLTTGSNCQNDGRFILHPQTASFMLALLQSLAASSIYKLQDLKIEFVQSLLAQVTTQQPSAAVFHLIQYLQANFPEQDVPKESELILFWMRRYVLGKTSITAREVAEVVVSLQPSEQSETIVHITERLIHDSKSRSDGAQLFYFWHEVLSNFVLSEVDGMFLKEEDFVNLRQKFSILTSVEEHVLVSGWIIFTLYYRRESDVKYGTGLNLESLGFEKLYQSRNRLELFSDVMGALSRYPLPYPDKFLESLQRFPSSAASGLRSPQGHSMQKSVKESIFSHLGDNLFYLHASSKFNDELVEFSESVNSNVHAFKDLARALIHKNQTNFKLVTRILKHNLALKNALCQSFPRAIDYRIKMETGNDEPGLTPEDALDLINHFAVSFALSQVISARSALIKVYWCYIFLHRYGAPIQAPITRALWHAGVTRYGQEGCSTTQLKWILSKVREVEGRHVANMLLWSSGFQNHRAKVLESMDWKDQEFSKLSSESKGRSKNLNQVAFEDEENVLELLEDKESRKNAHQIIPLPWEEGTNDQDFTSTTSISERTAGPGVAGSMLTTDPNASDSIGRSYDVLKSPDSTVPARNRKFLSLDQIHIKESLHQVHIQKSSAASPEPVVRKTYPRERKAMV